MKYTLPHKTWTIRLLKRLSFKWRVKKIIYTKFYVRHVGKIPYFDVEMDRQVDLRPALDSNARKPGISGFMRLRNEAQFVEMAIESVVDCLDELVIVHNGCTDRTPEIIEACRQRHPEKVRVYEYKPTVHLPGSEEHRSHPMGSPNSLVNYYNFALAKTTHKIALKIDGDDLFLPELFRKVTDKVRSGELSLPIGIIGINLWDANGEIKVNAEFPLKGGMDKGFFEVSPRTFFVHYRHYELFTYGFERSAGVVYYHLKGMKNDHGLANYNLQTGKTTFSPKAVAKFIRPALMPWAALDQVLPGATRLPAPGELGLVPRKQY
jgi:glycosyltransferase involved in cell wall biosynthesis